ncbi:RDD family protein [Microbacterium sp. NPDC058342]|uniref:RDD family protein n=1 Tax=Microbacterium sp. NPDC058342 TaxID=3346454 RepID=UPI00366687DA
MTMLPAGDVAPINRRAVAYIIDAAIGAGISVVVPVVVMSVVAAASGDVLTALVIAGPLFSILGLAWLVVYTLMQAGKGSIGMRTQGLRLAGVADGAPIGFGRALLRNIVWGLAAAIVVGYFTVLFDGSGRFQGWHDKVAGAIMLDARTSPAPAARARQHEAVGAPSAPGHAAPAAPQTAMPGFGAPPAQTSMPGFGAPPASFAPPAPQAAAPAPQPPTTDAAPPAPVAPSAPVAAQAPADDEFAEHTVMSPRIKRDLPDDPLISFVPGVTQEPVRPAERLVEPAVAEPAVAEPAVAEPAMPEPAAPEEVPASSPATAEFEAPAAEPAVPTAAFTAPVAEADPYDADDIESTRISVPGHRLVFTWDDGQRATVSGRTVFGRNPEEVDGAGNVAVRDETRSLSKTHFEAGSDVNGGWVMDRQSTNGTTLVRDGVRIACPPGQRVPVRLGDVLEIGDRIVTIGGYV